MENALVDSLEGGKLLCILINHPFYNLQLMSLRLDSALHISDFTPF
jgi:hypothetical protein